MKYSLSCYMVLALVLLAFHVSGSAFAQSESGSQPPEQSETVQDNPVTADQETEQPENTDSADDRDEDESAKEEQGREESAMMRALIVDGQNNHAVWPKTTQMMRRYLEQTGLFVVDVATTRAEGTDPDFKPEFTDYDVVISNYNGTPWSDETNAAFDEYMKAGGGLVIVHAADNSFPGWREFNEMIGLGGWGGRNEQSGPYVFLNEEGEEVRDESSGGGGGHGPQHEFAVVIRDDSHPITAGLPAGFMHSKDELYQNLRGPAANMKILATAWAAPEQSGSSRHEPMAMVIEYGTGRVFHTPLGHADYSMECSGFITLFQRGTQWAATGEVTQEVPGDFPAGDAVSVREFIEQNEESKALAETIVSMIEIVETKPTAEIFETLALPEELENIKNSPDAEAIYRAFEQDGKQVMLNALKSVPRSLLQVEGDTCKAKNRFKTINFKRIDGKWYIEN